MNTSGYSDIVLHEAARQLHLNYEYVCILAAVGDPAVIKKCREVEPDVEEKHRRDALSVIRR